MFFLLKGDLIKGRFFNLQNALLTFLIDLSPPNKYSRCSLYISINHPSFVQIGCIELSKWDIFVNLAFWLHHRLGRHFGPPELGYQVLLWSSTICLSKFTNQLEGRWTMMNTLRVHFLYLIKMETVEKDTPTTSCKMCILTK